MRVVTREVHHNRWRPERQIDTKANYEISRHRFDTSRNLDAQVNHIGLSTPRITHGSSTVSMKKPRWSQQPYSDGPLLLPLEADASLKGLVSGAYKHQISYLCTRRNWYRDWHFDFLVPVLFRYPIHNYSHLQDKQVFWQRAIPVPEWRP